MKGWNNFQMKNDKGQDSSDEEEVNKGKGMRHEGYEDLQKALKSCIKDNCLWAVSV